MELTINGKIEAWEKINRCLESRSKWFSMCGIISELFNNNTLSGYEFYYLKRTVSVDMQMKGNYLFQLMFPVDDKQSRIKYINNKIKQLENEK